MSTINLLYKDSYAINDKVKIVIPTVGEILEDEDNYYNLISMLTAMPIDLMCDLEDAGIDFTSINDYDLFLILFNSIAQYDTSLVFGDLDLSKFELGISQQNGNPVMFDEENDIVIDRAIHGRIAATIRKIHHLTKNKRKPGNKEAKEYMLERARIKRSRAKRSSDFSELENMVIALVNTEQFKYDYNGAKNMSIYQFNESLHQIIKKIDYEHKMHGIYSGIISAKEFSQDELNWLVHK